MPSASGAAFRTRLRPRALRARAPSAGAWVSVRGRGGLQVRLGLVRLAVDRLARVMSGKSERFSTLVTLPRIRRRIARTTRGGETLASETEARRSAMLGRIRHLFQAGVLGDLTDGQLLERFTTGPRRDRRARLRGAGGAARADGLAGLPPGAGRSSRRRGCVPGHLPGARPACPVRPPQGLGRELAPRRGLPRRLLCAIGGEPAEEA